MTTKEFLLRAWAVDARVERKLEERERLRAMLAASAAGAQGEGCADHGEAQEAVASAEAAIEAEIVKLCRAKREISEVIGAVADARLRQLLELRYRNYMTWEGVADEMGYELRHVYRLNRKALECVERIRRARTHEAPCEAFDLMPAERSAIEGQRSGATL